MPLNGCDSGCFTWDFTMVLVVEALVESLGMRPVICFLDCVQSMFGKVSPETDPMRFTYIRRISHTSTTTKHFRWFWCRCWLVSTSHAETNWGTSSDAFRSLFQEKHPSQIAETFIADDHFQIFNNLHQHHSSLLETNWVQWSWKIINTIKYIYIYLYIFI